MHRIPTLNKIWIYKFRTFVYSTKWIKTIHQLQICEQRAPVKLSPAIDTKLANGNLIADKKLHPTSALASKCIGNNKSLHCRDDRWRVEPPPRTGNIHTLTLHFRRKRLILVAFMSYAVEFAAMPALVYVRCVTALGTYNRIFNYANGQVRVDHVCNRARFSTRD